MNVARAELSAAAAPGFESTAARSWMLGLVLAADGGAGSGAKGRGGCGACGGRMAEDKEGPLGWEAEGPLRWPRSLMALSASSENLEESWPGAAALGTDWPMVLCDRVDPGLSESWTGGL